MDDKPIRSIIYKSHKNGLLDNNAGDEEGFLMPSAIWNKRMV